MPRPFFWIPSFQSGRKSPPKDRKTGRPLKGTSTKKQWSASSEKVRKGEQQRSTSPEKAAPQAATGGGFHPFQAAARDAVARAFGQSTGPPLQRVRARAAWRRSSGKAAFIHPLRAKEFFEQHLGKRALLLRRGPRHPLQLTEALAQRLLHSHRLGINAELVEVSAQRRMGREPRGSRTLDLGAPASLAVTQGKSVRLDAVEKKLPGLLLRDRFLAVLSRMAPGRGITASLSWAPAGQLAVPRRILWYDQLVIQVSGSRQWVVCRRGDGGAVAAGGKEGAAKQQGEAAPSTPLSSRNLKNSSSQLGSDGGRVPRRCSKATLRRGDLLYLPAQTPHFALKGPLLSVHAALSLLPLLAADFVVVSGMQKHIVAEHPSLGLPLPLWRSRGPEEDGLPRPRELLPAFCEGLPWLDKRKSKAVCQVAFLKRCWHKMKSSMRIIGTSGHRPGAQEEEEGEFPEEEEVGQSTVAGEQAAKSAARLQEVQGRKRGRRAVWSSSAILVAVFGGLLALFLVFAAVVVCCEQPETVRRRRAQEQSKKED